jgi:hypothetical protein
MLPESVSTRSRISLHDAKEKEEQPAGRIHYLKVFLSPEVLALFKAFLKIVDS